MKKPTEYAKTNKTPAYSRGLSLNLETFSTTGRERLRRLEFFVGAGLKPAPTRKSFHLGEAHQRLLHALMRELSRRKSL